MRFVEILAVTALAAPLAFGANCDALAGLKLADTTITAAKSMPAAKNLPAYCQVSGVIKPTPVSVINFQVWLPEAGWNGKLQTVGNGGLAGTISTPALGTALRSGFAAASTDTGHTSDEPKTWLQNKERLIDYSYRGLHLTTVDAKSIVDAYYGQNPTAAIYTGCSTGGKQGLMEAQRYPADFDGIVAGDAANFWTGQMANEVWSGVATGSPESALPEAKLQLIQNAVLEQCDALDGVKDGLIADSRRCKFDPKPLLCKGADAATCLTAPQLAAVQKLYTGPVNPRTGKALYAGFYPGGELGWGGNGRPAVINRPGKSSGVSSYDFMRFALFANPEWDFHSFDFDRDFQALDEKFGPVANATDANLEQFRKLGHKMIYYHGASDPLIPAQNGVNYYESVVAYEKGLDKTQTFFRAFLVPGLYHCGGGPGAIGFGTSSPASQADADHDVVSAAVRWVEKGVAPEKIIATKYIDGSAAKGIAFQRPLCAYPLAARYKGTGDTNDVANFACVK